MKITDTHAHINMLKNPEMGIIEARDAGVGNIIIPTAGIEDFEPVLDLCHRFENTYALLGIHPEYADNFNDKIASQIYEFAKDDKVVGIGEIGLDYHYSKENKDSQKNCFINQIQIAKHLNLPIVVHDRDAHLDTFDILREEKAKRVLLHCFSGSPEFMELCIREGYSIAIGGVVTFKNAKAIKEVAKNVDINHLMLETDCPYLAPHPYRGEENSPKYLGFIVNEIANLKDMPPDSIILKTSENASRFFNIECI